MRTIDDAIDLQFHRPGEAHVSESNTESNTGSYNEIYQKKEEGNGYGIIQGLHSDPSESDPKPLRMK